MSKTVQDLIAEAVKGITPEDRAKSATYTFTNLEASALAAGLSAILAIHHGEFDLAEITINALAVPEAHNLLADILHRFIEAQAPPSLKSLGAKLDGRVHTQH